MMVSSGVARQEGSGAMTHVRHVGQVDVVDYVTLISLCSVIAGKDNEAYCDLVKCCGGISDDNCLVDNKESLDSACEDLTANTSVLG